MSLQAVQYREHHDNMPAFPKVDLPDANSADLVLRHPTAEEYIAIWNNTASSWADALPLPVYIEESMFLTTIPLARDGGLTGWILVHKDQLPNQRHILCSCESYIKRTITSDCNGVTSDNFVHGIASVFCAPPYRGRRYPQRMLQELAKKLTIWRTNELPCVGTTLYSDIGKHYYAKLGWRLNATNSQVEIRPAAIAWPHGVQQISEFDIGELCMRDEARIRAQMAVPAEGYKTRFTVIPDVKHMAWHLGKETFTTNYLFGKVPTVKGAIIGSPGNQIWVLWTHRYYNRLDDEAKNNVLYILRLVVEVDETATRLPSDAAKRPCKEVLEQQTTYLKKIMQAAQAEANEWCLDSIEIWDPTPLVEDLLVRTGVEHRVVEREETNLASLMWYAGAGSGGKEDAPLWVNNEHYAWQ